MLGGTVTDSPRHNSKRRGVQIKPLHTVPIPRLSLREPEAAEALGVSASWLRREALAGRVPSVLIAGVRLYPIQHLREWLSDASQKSDQSDEVAP